MLNLVSNVMKQRLEFEVLMSFSWSGLH